MPKLDPECNEPEFLKISFGYKLYVHQEKKKNYLMHYRENSLINEAWAYMLIS